MRRAGYPASSPNPSASEEDEPCGVRASLVSRPRSQVVVGTSILQMKSKSQGAGAWRAPQRTEPVTWACARESDHTFIPAGCFLSWEVACRSDGQEALPVPGLRL